MRKEGPPQKAAGHGLVSTPVLVPSKGAEVGRQQRGVGLAGRTLEGYTAERHPVGPVGHHPVDDRWARWRAASAGGTPSCAWTAARTGARAPTRVAPGPAALIGAIAGEGPAPRRRATAHADPTGGSGAGRSGCGGSPGSER